MATDLKIFETLDLEDYYQYAKGKRDFITLNKYSELDFSDIYGFLLENSQEIYKDVNYDNLPFVTYKVSRDKLEGLLSLAIEKSPSSSGNDGRVVWIIEEFLKLKRDYYYLLFS